MELLVGVAVWAVLGIVLLVPPLMRDDDESLDNTWPLSQNSVSSDETTSTTTTESTATSDDQQMTDGNRVCHNCGSDVAEEYRYCGECLVPEV